MLLVHCVRELLARLQIVPTNAPVARTDSNDVVFRVKDAKWKATVTEIKRMHKSGRPVLVGTTSVETSELVSGMLKEEGIPHEVRFVNCGRSAPCWAALDL
jgi:preprotein translocase subunit SecA